MDRRSWTWLLVLAAIWGASYLFIEIGLRDFSPEVIAWMRVALAALVLVPIAAQQGALAGTRSMMGWLALIGLTQVAGPFVLIGMGQEEITSGLAGTLVASAPLFTALLAVRFDQEERSRGLRLAGVLVGFGGVGVLLGVDLGGSGAALLGGTLVVVASLGYAIGGFIVKHRLTGIAPLGMSSMVMLTSTVILAPSAALSTPDTVGLGPFAAVLALGVIGTGAAFVIFYWLISTAGPARAFIVTFIAPAFAVVYGATLLDEKVTVATLAGLALILSGSWLAVEGGLPRQVAEAEPPEPPAVKGSSPEAAAPAAARD